MNKTVQVIKIIFFMFSVSNIVTVGVQTKDSNISHVMSEMIGVFGISQNLISTDSPFGVTSKPDSRLILPEINTGTKSL